MIVAVQFDRWCFMEDGKMEPFFICKDVSQYYGGAMLFMYPLDFVYVGY